MATIGFFDGVHCGHCFLIRQVECEAAARGLAPTVITFPTHPRQVLQSEYRPHLLTTPAEKLQRLHCLLQVLTELLFFTDRCQVYKTRASEFPDTKASVLGDFVAAKLGFDEGESAAAMVATAA